jgi:integrase
MASPKPITVAQYNGSKPLSQLDQPNTTFIIDKTSGRKIWRYRVRTKQVTYDTNIRPSGNLQQDRAKFAEWNALVRQGVHPNQTLKPLINCDFQQYAERWMDKYLHERTDNIKNRQQWRNTLRDYVYPKIGNIPVGQIQTSHIEGCLSDIWKAKHETATRIVGRLHTILDKAINEKIHPGPNPADYRARLKSTFLPINKRTRVKHFPSLHPKYIPELFQLLRADQSKASLCLQLIILTACRKNEIKSSEWREIYPSDDIDCRVLAIPARRMKMQEDHTVPITDQMELILTEIEALSESEVFLFPSPQKRNAPISDTVLDKKLKQIQTATTHFRNQDKKSEDRSHWTIHGFRASFRTWAAEGQYGGIEIIETSLAHSLKGMADTYQRGDFIKPRYELMKKWNDYCFSGNDR